MLIFYELRLLSFLTYTECTAVAGIVKRYLSMLFRGCLDGVYRVTHMKYIEGN